MRIIAGTHGGRRLLVPKGRDIRPTSDKIRGAIFNALRSRGAVEDAIVLDGFCGTGALGLEALSQGAASCVFIDKDRTSLELAKENATALGLINRSKFLLKELAKYGQKSENEELFSLVFLDPPYSKDLTPPALTALHEGNRLTNGAIIVVEAEKGFAESIPHTYTPLDERVYGETKVLTLSYKSS